MNYLELLRDASPKHKLSFITMATTGIKKDDQIIAVFLGQEDGPIAGMACEGISDDMLSGTYRYHRISKPMYDNMIKVSREVMYNSLYNFFNNDVIVSYNIPFMCSMINKLTDTEGGPIDAIDICNVCRWVNSGQIFTTAMDANYGKMKSSMDGWYSSKTYGIKNTIKEVIPEYSEDLSKPAPEAMVEALRCLCKFLEKKPVRIAQDLQV